MLHKPDSCAQWILSWHTDQIRRHQTTAIFTRIMSEQASLKTNCCSVSDWESPRSNKHPEQQAPSHRVQHRDHFSVTATSPLCWSNEASYLYSYSSAERNCKNLKENLPPHWTEGRFSLHGSGMNWILSGKDIKLFTVNCFWGSGTLSVACC